MASSSKKPKDENKKRNITAIKSSKKAIKSPEKKPINPKNKHIKTPDKKPSTPKIANISKTKPGSKPDKSKNKNKSKSENKDQKNVKSNNKRKRKEEEEEEEVKVCMFPMNRIKRIIKSEDPRIAVSQDVVFLVNKATEMFLETFCKDGYKYAMKDRKKSLSYKHLSSVVHEQKRYDFLSDYVPQKIKAEDALQEMKLTGEG